ncbi:MAG: D-glycero-beta-D-manno-heptose-7-phosphate kinase [Candidatus Omnitrophota bacterium]|nr:D-glycero-beta-D-manno-heptose-7-phosphate kinase [Candidatus Omnitrophota bacterium]MBU1929588.1 D-glycero-beta-D-manno-heptose-7-phosphate kinase [Candidatus Omnitrophota bacterium]MBU2034781.1 D-glycero-beta-D-manno-heptose-7-phosphate kinase [Candidatus Omnitrophota bacterium]MBU2221483.1 D-glycero-beta-D-manno-heptose-7-phosphate kinase [Candidatus Omnitrophota bacterium]MBU2257805.1 D-glycero-beta-D-manno-heptose-7-phosphate kinase [Candidatus Omnitrophota bacterium]
MPDFEQIINKFNKANILVIGDLILDEFIWGDVERISPEAPVPVVWAKKRTFIPGGAANVANNIRSLDGNVCLAGVIGKDKNTGILLAELKKRKISTAGIFATAQRCTTLKTRIVAGHQQVVRLDWEDVEPLTRQTNQGIIGFIRRNIHKFDAIIIEDYGKGVINMELLGMVLSLARKHKKIINVDPKEEHFQYYKGVTCITPNRKELENAARNIKIRDNTNRFKLDNYRLSAMKDVDVAAEHIMRYLDLDAVLVTLGEQGMKLFEKNKKVVHIPTVAQEVFDVSGAGDTVIAAFTLSLCSGAAKVEAARIANYAAGIVVGKLGTAVTNRKELLEKLNKV